MKKTVINLLSGALILAASISCGKELPGLTINFENSAENAEYSITQANSLEIPFTVGSLEGFAVAVNATCSDENYQVNAELNQDGASGTVTLTAPEYIFEDASLKITITVTDAENSRTTTQEIEVTAKSILENLAVSSNCHLVSPGSFIKFAAVKGNSTEKVALASVELLWEDNIDLIDSVFTVSKEELYVNIAAEKTGNAVVCAKSAEGTILWSWHIWVSAEDATASSMEYTYTDAEGVSTTFHFMDRNIGALTSKLGTGDVNGCFYQWGRKDPFPAPTIVGTFKTIYNKEGAETEIATETTNADNNIETATQNPMVRYNGVSAGNYGWLTKDVANISKDLVVDLWGGVSKSKSMYDPCPAGYRVPQVAAWQFLSDKNIAKDIVYRDGAPEKPANSDQLGRKVNLDGTDFFFPNQGESNQKTSLQAGYTNGYGIAGNNWPCGKLWSSQFDGNFDGTAAKKSYFRAYTNNVTPSSTSYYANFSLGYAVAVRCIKE